MICVTWEVLVLWYARLGKFGYSGLASSTAACHVIWEVLVQWSAWFGKFWYCKYYDAACHVTHSWMGGEFCYCDHTLFVTPKFASLLDLYFFIVQYVNMDRFLKRSAPPDGPVIGVDYTIHTIRKYLNQYTVSINHNFLGNPTPTLLIIMTYLMVTAYKKEGEVGRR
jgi:hypothetical protein